MIDPSNIRYEKISAQEMIEKHFGMLEDHFKEAEHSVPDKKLKLNRKLFETLEASGKMFVLAAVDSSIDMIIGYCAFIIDESYLVDVKVANELGVYVVPIYRNYGIGAGLLLNSELLLKEQGVEVMKMILKDKNQGMHSEIYDLGYELEELTFHKRI